MRLINATTGTIEMDVLENGVKVSEKDWLVLGWG